MTSALLSRAPQVLAQLASSQVSDVPSALLKEIQGLHSDLLQLQGEAQAGLVEEIHPNSNDPFSQVLKIVEGALPFVLKALALL